MKDCCYRSQECQIFDNPQNKLPWFSASQKYEYFKLIFCSSKFLCRVYLLDVGVVSMWQPYIEIVTAFCDKKFTKLSVFDGQQKVSSSNGVRYTT